MAYNAILDWSDTVELIGVNAFDENGNRLPADQFTVQFSAPLAVPEPVTLGLFGVGLALQAWRSRRRRRIGRSRT